MIANLPQFRASRLIESRGTAAFTLIEMLAAMTILVVVIMFMGRVVTESTNLWTTGMRRSEANNAGRAIVEFMVRDLSAALADDVIRFQVSSDVDDVYGFSSDRVRLVSLDQLGRVEQVPSGQLRYYRGAREIVYYLGPMRDVNNKIIPHRYRLLRNRVIRFDDGVTAYTSGAHSNPNVQGGIKWVEKGVAGLQVAENVRTLEFWAYSYNYQSASFNSFNFDTHQPYPGQPDPWGPPLWIDFYIELMGESDARQAAELASIHGEDGAITRDFVERNSQRFAARAHLQNAAGYNRPREYYPFYEPYHNEFAWPLN